MTDSFWDQVSGGKPDECWLWEAGRHKKGYGTTTINGRLLYAHRVAWELVNMEKIPDGLCVLHKCDNPPCVNPKHLFLGTQTDNMLDMWRKGRGVPPPIGDRAGEKHPRHILTDDDVHDIRESYNPKNGVTQAVLGKRHGVSRSTVGDVLTGRKWAHLPVR